MVQKFVSELDLSVSTTNWHTKLLEKEMDLKALKLFIEVVCGKI